MNTPLPRLAWLAIAAWSCLQVQAAPKAASQPAEFRLTVELWDGSRVIGKSLDDSFRFNSDTLGKTKLPLQKIRSVEYQTKTNLARLTTSSADSLAVEIATKEIRVQTSFGKVSLPVSLIKNVRVSRLGVIGRPKDGLIGLWSGNGNAVDSVAGNNGVLQNVGFTDGVVGKAFTFASDGLPYGYAGVQIPDNPAYELTHSLTIEGWIRPHSGGYVVFFRGDHRPALDPYCLSMDGHLNLIFAISGQDGATASAQTPVEQYVWTHVAGVLDDAAGTVSLYTNGVLAAKTVTTVRPFAALLPDESPGIGIGNVNDGGNNFPFIGDIDEIALYNRPLSEDEINGIYSENAANAGDRAKPLPTRAKSYSRFPRTGSHPNFNSE